jgi:hypothetical protein
MFKNDMLLKLSAEQLSLFEAAEEKEAGTPEGISTYEDDRFDISGIDWSRFPRSQVPIRKKIIEHLLRNNKSITKDEIIERILALHTDPYTFDIETRKYRKFFPELYADIPEALDPNQLRLPDMPPDIRFLPDPKRTEEEREILVQKQKDYDSTLKQLKDDYFKEHGTNPDWDAQWRMQGEARGLHGDRPDDRKINTEVDFNVGEEEYKSMISQLYNLYRAAELKRGELATLVMGMKESMPEKPPEASSGGFDSLDDYIEDLKYRIYYWSYKSLYDSAGFSIFGASTGYHRDRRVISGFFSKGQEVWQDDPEELKDYLERSPSPFNYWRSASVSDWYRNKRDSLTSYADSIERSIKSFKKGMRFMGKLKKALDKEVDERLAKNELTKMKSVVRYIEKHHGEKLDIAYQRIINSLERDFETQSRHSSTYSFAGGFNINGYSYMDKEDREQRALEAFDINLLFHNKIAMWEVVDNFASLIMVMLGGVRREVVDNLLVNSFERATQIIQDEVILEATGYQRDVILPDIMLDVGGVQFSAPNNEIVDGILENWKNYSKGGSIGYNSILMYPKFIIKDQEIMGNVQSSLKNTLAMGIIENLTSERTKQSIISVISKLLNARRIPLGSSNEEDIVNSILGKKDLIKAAVKVYIGKYASSVLSPDLFKMRDHYDNWAVSTGDDYNDLSSLVSDLSSAFIPGDSYSRGTTFRISYLERPRDISPEELSDKRRKQTENLINLALHYDPDAGQAFIAAVKAKLKRFSLLYLRGVRHWNRLTVEYLNRKDLELEILNPDRAMMTKWLENPESFAEDIESLPDIEPNEEGFRNYPKYLSGDESIPSSLNGLSELEHYSNEAIESSIILDEIIPKINKARDEIAGVLPGASRQLKTLLYASAYRAIFSQRMKAFHSVGPRAISKKYRDLARKLRMPESTFKKLVNSWSNNLVSNVAKNIDLAFSDEDETSSGSTLYTSNDRLTELYNAAKNGFNEMKDKKYIAALLIVKKHNLEHPDQINKVFNACESNLTRGLGNFGYEELKTFIPMIVTDLDSLDSKISKVYKVSAYAHNNSGLPRSFFVRLLKNKNFGDMDKSVFISKYFKMGARLAKLGNLTGIRKRYQPVIDSLITSGMISKGFYTRIRRVSRVFRTGERLRPNLEGLGGEELDLQADIRELIDETHTDLEAIEEYETLSEYNGLVVEKVPEVFRLNWEVRTNNFRFRVLSNYDPFHFKVGVQTSCCQRLGGVGEAAAIDSYINPFAGVLVLDFFVDSKWVMAAQSYFHYVPRDKGYILDNVEHNYRVANRAVMTTGHSLEELYAMLAKRTEDNFDIEYFSAGKGYSKIDADDFKKMSVGYSDPRTFSWNKKYTDWKAKSSLNLLEPKFEVGEIPEDTSMKRKRRRRVRALEMLYGRIVC